MLEVDLSYDIENNKEYLDENKILEFTTFIVKGEKGDEFDNNDYYVSLLVTNNEIIQNINRDYRGKDMPTDVISFAYNETENFGPVEVIGDIVISQDRVIEQAKEYNHSEEREFYYVLCHGLLHILGYDHIEEEDKKIMRAKEEYYLSKFDLKRD